MAKVKQFLSEYLYIWICLFVGIVCTVFLLVGKPAEDGTITLNAQPAEISETTKKWIESQEEAMYRLMNEDAPTDEETIKANSGEAEGKGFYTTIDDVLGRILPDGSNDNGAGFQCSRYTGWLGTGQWSYSSAHPDYGPRHGKDMAQWLVDNYGYKYIDKPVKGAIGSGYFNTTYGHTALFLYWIDGNTAMVNDANYVPLTVATHPLDVSGWVWVVPGSYNPEPEPTPTPEPVVSVCDKWTLQWGETLGQIMKTCEGSITWGEAMNSYARTWVDESTGKTVYEGWITPPGIGLYSGHTIVKK